MSLGDTALREAQSVAATARTLPERARALVITSQETFEEAGAFLVAVKGRRNAIADAFAPVIAAGLRAHREALALHKQADAPCAEAETIVKRTMGEYQHEQELRRIEAEAAARQERIRLEAEARAVAEQEQRDAVAAAEAEQMSQAEQAMDAGDLDRAQRILDASTLDTIAVMLRRRPVVPAAVQVPPVVLPPVPTAAGVSFTTHYDYRLVDERQVGRAYLMLDDKKIAAVVRALGPDAEATVGGISVYPTTSVRVRP